ncbi:hypothetical protein MSAN_02119800 [Mycena sanguinolenta]|uniref:Uncharacterized protein n=1 Tax=Mycena sanguinolenta TaxID=230812 RepID=A0A8H6XGW3_9AGAR|nr:hypothetical protein MSAN_02119800 [Mycena sanguinolenta]
MIVFSRSILYAVAPKVSSASDPNQSRTIAAALSTRTGATMAEVTAALRRASIEEWGKVRRIDSDAGDTMRSCSLGIVAEDAKGATYVRYEMLVDPEHKISKPPRKL